MFCLKVSRNIMFQKSVLEAHAALQAIKMRYTDGSAVESDMFLVSSEPLASYLGVSERIQRTLFF